MTIQKYEKTIEKQTGLLQECEHEGLKIMYSKSVSIQTAVKVTLKMRHVRCPESN